LPFPASIYFHNDSKKYDDDYTKKKTIDHISKDIHITLVNEWISRHFRSVFFFFTFNKC